MHTANYFNFSRFPYRNNDIIKSWINRIYEDEELIEFLDKYSYAIIFGENFV